MVATCATPANPYLEAFQACDGESYGERYSNYLERHRCIARYSWAVPNLQALEAIAARGPIVEIGAGTGYWASLLRQMGVDVVAYDIEPPKRGRVNSYHRVRAEANDGVAIVGHAWTEVLKGDARVAGKHPDRTLFLCWPPYAEPMAADALTAYLAAGGQSLIFVGEWRGDCTADYRYFELEEQFFGDYTELVDIPQWAGIHDSLRCYQRLTTVRELPVPLLEGK